MLTDQQYRQLFELAADVSPTARENIQSIYLSRLGADIVNYLLEYYPKESKAAVRGRYISLAIPYAREEAGAIHLARIALSDRGRSVRDRALALFAYLQKDEYIPMLKQHIKDKPTDRDLVYKAITAIERQDYELYASIDHPARHYATIRWTVTKPDTKAHLDKEQFRKTVEIYLEGYCPDIARKLKVILGEQYK